MKFTATLLALLVSGPSLFAATIQLRDCAYLPTYQGSSVGTFVGSPVSRDGKLYFNVRFKDESAKVQGFEIQTVAMTWVDVSASTGGSAMELARAVTAGEISQIKAHCSTSQPGASAYLKIDSVMFRSVPTDLSDVDRK